MGSVHLAQTVEVSADDRPPTGLHWRRVLAALIVGCIVGAVGFFFDMSWTGIVITSLITMAASLSPWPRYR
jgi:hypothetical protein